MSREGLYNERVGDTKRGSKITVNPDKISSRPIRAVGLLLILQAIGLVGLVAYGLLQVDWQQVRSDSQQQGLELEIQPDSSQQEGEEESELEAARAIVVTILFLPSIILAILGALGFLLFSRRGWLLASLAQTLNLWACLQLYYEWNPGLIYPVMLFCIFLILYLNSYNVRVVFHSRRKPAKTVGQDLEAVHDS